MARYLSRADLSRIAGKYIDQYYTRFGISKDTPEPIDPERLANAVLGLNVKMLPLCSDGSVLGLTVFQRCGFTVTLGDGTKLVEIFMPKDVVIDSALAAELLMPTFLINAEIERVALTLPNGILYKSVSDPNYEKILEMAQRIGGFLVCNQDQTAADAGYKRQTHPLPSIGHHPFWRINMIQSNRRSFKNKPLSNIQQAQFSIGWRFCPVCGNKLYKKIDGCSSTLQVKCSKCKETLRLDLAFRCR